MLTEQNLKTMSEDSSSKISVVLQETLIQARKEEKVRKKKRNKDTKNRPVKIKTS